MKSIREEVEVFQIERCKTVASAYYSQIEGETSPQQARILAHKIADTSKNNNANNFSNITSGILQLIRQLEAAV